MKKCFAIAGISLLIILCGVFFLHLQLTKPLKDRGFDDSYVFEIDKGSSNHKIFNDLAKKNIIFDAKLSYLFRAYQYLFPNLFLKAGEYQFLLDDDFYSILNKINENKNYLRRYTIIEGSTVAEAVQILNDNEYLVGDIANVPEEGYLLPETYFYKKGDNRQSQIDLMKKSQEKILNAAWQERDKNLKLTNKRELLILASIIEKETGLKSERAEVSSVFNNRLRIGMKLQSDPTVIYAITKGRYKLERPLSKKDLRINSPYSTYYKYGLPKTAIANPGKKAIFAAANPKKTKYLYFVSDGNGNHLFSKSLVEHNIYVRKLRALERQRRK